MVGILLEQRLEMFGILQEGKTHGRVGGEWLGPSRKGKLGIFGISQEQGTPPRIRGRAFWECRVTQGSIWDPPLQQHPPCREHSLIFPVIQATALAPILVPKFRSKGVGQPPCAGRI